MRAHVGSETPENGRRSYHGTHELMASNHLDVCDVTSFAGHAQVEQWLEEDDNDVQTGLYWRQIYDVRTGNLSVRIQAALNFEILIYTDQGTGVKRALCLPEVL